MGVVHNRSVRTQSLRHQWAIKKDLYIKIHRECDHCDTEFWGRFNTCENCSIKIPDLASFKLT